MLRAQAGIEYAFVAALIVSLVVFIAVPVFREWELSVALENARRECVEVAWENGVEFAQLDYSLEGKTLFIEPEFYYANGSLAAVDAGNRPVQAVRNAFGASGKLDEDGCFQVLNYRYCVR